MPADGTPIAEREWILHSPYEEPSSHWALDEHGRATEDTTPGWRNRLRRHVASWRAQAWPGVTRRAHQIVGVLVLQRAGDAAVLVPARCGDVLWGMVFSEPQTHQDLSFGPVRIGTLNTSENRAKAADQMRGFFNEAANAFGLQRGSQLRTRGT